jgi:glycosyltransferase involved in cell wall biosynthesis
VAESPCRIAYVSGPIDAVQVYDQWRRSKGSGYYGTIYLLQLYEILQDVGAKALIITTLSTGRWSAARENVEVVNLPMPEGVGGVRYHIAMLAWAFRCVAAIIRFRADGALLTAGQNYFWAFTPLRLFGTRLIASLHCTLWPPFAPRKRLHRVLNALNGIFFYPFCDHVQSVSEEAAKQVRLTAVRLPGSEARFLATYDPRRFEDVDQPVWPQTGVEFRLLYVGRLTANKGVFDLVRIMEMLEQHHPEKFHLDVCGIGPAEGKLRSVIREAGLDGSIKIHGQCITARLQELYASSHAVVVPTRSDFEEGTPKVAFEAVLNFRPVVMSAACPALADVIDATEEAGVDDVESYVSAILRLAGDRRHYKSKVRGASACRKKHFEEHRSYGARLRPAICALAKRKA